MEIGSIVNRVTSGSEKQQRSDTNVGSKKREREEVQQTRGLFQGGCEDVVDYNETSNILQEPSDTYFESSKRQRVGEQEEQQISSISQGAYDTYIETSESKILMKEIDHLIEAFISILNKPDTYCELLESKTKTLVKEIYHLIENKDMSGVIDKLKGLDYENKIGLENYCYEVLSKKDLLEIPISIFCLGCIKLLDSETAGSYIDILNSLYVKTYDKSHPYLVGYILYLCGRYNEKNGQECYEWYEDAYNTYGNIKAWLRLNKIIDNEIDSSELLLELWRITFNKRNNYNIYDLVKKIISSNQVGFDFKVETIIKYVKLVLDEIRDLESESNYEEHCFKIIDLLKTDSEIKCEAKKRLSEMF